MKQYARYLISAVITCFIMVGISFFIEDPSQAKGTWIVGCIVAAVIIAMPIYSIGAWSLKRRTIMHTLAMVVTVLPLMLLSDWFDWRTSGGLIALLGVFCLFGIVGWTIGYFTTYHRNKRA